MLTGQPPMPPAACAECGDDAQEEGGDSRGNPEGIGAGPSTSDDVRCKVVPPSYKLIYNPINCRYIYHKSYLLEL